MNDPSGTVTTEWRKWSPLTTSFLLFPASSLFTPTTIETRDGSWINWAFHFCNLGWYIWSNKEDHQNCNLMYSVHLNKVRVDIGKMFFGSARKFKLNVVLTFTIAVVSMGLIWLIRYFLFVWWIHPLFFLLMNIPVFIRFLIHYISCPPLNLLFSAHSRLLFQGLFCPGFLASLLLFV